MNYYQATAAVVCWRLDLWLGSAQDMDGGGRQGDVVAFPLHFCDFETNRSWRI